MEWINRYSSKSMSNHRKSPNDLSLDRVQMNCRNEPDRIEILRTILKSLQKICKDFGIVLHFIFCCYSYIHFRSIKNFVSFFSKFCSFSTFCTICFLFLPHFHVSILCWAGSSALFITDERECEHMSSTDEHVLTILKQYLDDKYK